MLMFAFLAGVGIENNCAFIIMNPVLFLAFLCQLIAINRVHDLSILLVLGLLEPTVMRLGDIALICLRKMAFLIDGQRFSGWIIVLFEKLVEGL